MRMEMAVKNMVNSMRLPEPGAISRFQETCPDSSFCVDSRLRGNDGKGFSSFPRKRESTRDCEFALEAQVLPA